MQNPNLKPFQKDIEAFCKRWNIEKLELFGSALRDDFGPDSDFDFLVTFAGGVQITYFDFFDLQDELTELLGRKVDVFTRRSVENCDNSRRKKLILNNAELVHVS